MQGTGVDLNVCTHLCRQLLVSVPTNPPGGSHHWRMPLAAPRRGDVVIRRERGNSGSFFYSVREIPGSPQISCGSSATALVFGKRFAGNRQTALWQERDGEYTLLALPPEEAPPEEKGVA